MDAGMLLAYTALLLLALLPIYKGSWESVDGPNEPNADKKKQKETFSSSDAYWFPVTGSAVLFSLYLVFRFFEKEYVNYLLTAYFGVIGFGALASLVASYMPSIEAKLGLHPYTLKLTKAAEIIYSLEFTNLTFVTSIVCLFVTVFWIVTKHWLLNNLFGLTFSITAIALLNLDSFKTGMALLAGLFFYDVFWVFGTDVMVTVAKNFDAPIKMVWPKSILDSKAGFTMLGLGDIVIPGIYVALCLRFDFHNYLKQNKRARKTDAKFKTPYFNVCFAAYIFGLITTVFVMHTFKAAQPALLYLSPACIISSALTAMSKGQLAEFFAWSSEIDTDVTKSTTTTTTDGGGNNNNDNKSVDKKEKNPRKSTNTKQTINNTTQSNATTQPITASTVTSSSPNEEDRKDKKKSEKSKSKGDDNVPSTKIEWEDITSVSDNDDLDSLVAQSPLNQSNQANQDLNKETKTKKKNKQKKSTKDTGETTSNLSASISADIVQGKKHSPFTDDSMDQNSNEDSDMIPVLSRKNKKLLRKQQE